MQILRIFIGLLLGGILPIQQDVFASKADGPITVWSHKVRFLHNEKNTYIFGEGNPKHLVLDQIGLANILDNCTAGKTKDFLCSEGADGYITPEIEFALQIALSSHDWQNLIRSCQKDLVNYEKENRRFYGYTKKYFSHINAIDINKFLIVDRITGRKRLSVYFSNLDDFLFPFANPGGSTGDIDQYTCINQYGKVLSQMLNNIALTYKFNVAYMLHNEKVNYGDILNNGLPPSDQLYPR